MEDTEVSIEEISLCEQYNDRPQELVCRTCVKTVNKFWAHDAIDVARAKIDADFDETTMKCSPTKVWGDVKILHTTDPKNRIVDIQVESASKTRAFIETCGHEIKRECVSCERFVPISTNIGYPSNPDSEILYRPVEKNGKTYLEPYAADGSNVRSWNVAIGGSCSLPVAGITKNNQTVYCDFIPKGKNVESPSCGNCYYLDYAGDNWQFGHLEVNDNASLTPWEKEQAIKSAEAEDMPIGQAIGLALWRKQTEGHGRILSFTAEVLRKDYHQGTLKYKLRFKSNNVIAVVSAYDVNIFVNDDVEIGFNYIDSVNPIRNAAVEIKWPFHKQFSLQDNLKIVKRIWPDLPEKIQINNEGWDELLDPKCPRCNTKRNLPCYYHSKRPRWNLVTGIVEFTTGRQTKTVEMFPPHGVMHVENRYGSFVAVDGNGNMPVAYSDTVANASVFRLYLPELLRKTKAKYGKDAYNSIVNQYNKVTSMLHYTQPIKVRPSWLKPSTVEPSKPRCTNPNGLDLRKVFMDSFGSERADIDYDFGAHNTAVVEEELRVGKRQHEQTPQRLHEEILATITSHPRYREEIGGIVTTDVEWPKEMHTTVIEAIGGMYDEEGNPITDTAEFMDRLDEQVVMGYSGDVERMFSVRQQLFGYELSRGYYGSRRGSEKTVMPSFEGEFAIFADLGESDQVDVNDAWRCTHCSRTYNQIDIENWFSPTCECGHALYKNHTSRVSYNARATGGIGNALAMDSEGMRQKQMLYANLCPKWRLNTQNAVITLSDLAGKPVSSIHETPVHINAKRGPDIHKVGGFLTEEHIASNEAYALIREEVYAQREAYKVRFPDVTIVDLETKFPLPYGIVYVEKAAGSLAKMGGM